MIQVTLKTLAQNELLCFARAQLRFSANDLATHCPAGEQARSRFLAEMLEAGVVVECGTKNRVRYFTTWGEAEVDNIKALEDTDGSTGRASRAHLLGLIEIASACGISVDVPTTGARTPEEVEIWQYITGRAYFTFEDVVAAFPKDPLMTASFIRRLTAGKVIRFWGANNGQKLYSAKGLKTERTVAQDLRSTTEGAIWTAIRIKRRFRPSDLLAALRQSREGISQDEITKYCRTLIQAGFIKPPKPTKRVSQDTPLVLVKNAGPLPPQTRRVTVIIDPNEDKIVYSPLGQA